MANCLPGATEEPAEHRHAHEQARDQRAHMARMRVLRKDRGLDHRAVPWQHARMVGDEKRAAGGWDVLDPGCLDPPVVAIHQVEQRQERFGPLRVEAEVVDGIVRASLREFALLVQELDDLHQAVHVNHLAAGDLAKAG